MNLTIDSARATIIDGTAAVTINSGVALDTRLLGILVLDTLTGTCATSAAFYKRTRFGQDIQAAITLPASSVAGFFDMRGAVNEVAGLTVTCSDAADDEKVIVLWAPNP